MDRNFSTKFVLTLSVLVMFLWLASNGCTSRTADPPLVQTSSAQITVSSNQIANGNVVLNTILDQTISIKNTGSARLTIGQIGHANPLAPPFSIVSDDCSARAVEPSAACSFKVQFSPTAQGTFTDNFDIPSDASNENSVTVGVTGSGKALRVAINQVNTDSCPNLELIVNVTDKNNAFLAGLVSDDFTLKENSVPQALAISQVTTTIPVSLAMVLDYSGSMLSQIPTLEAASINFIGYLNPGDEAAIIKFAQFPQVMQDFTSTKADLITAITTTPSQIGGPGTYLYDTLWFAVGKTAMRLNHKAIVLVSDGKDAIMGVPNVSVKTLNQVIAYAAENGVAIYAVGLGDVEGGVMNRLASETGGQYYYITDAGQLSDVYQAINKILLGQYSIKYFSSLHGGSLITLSIDVVAGTDEGAAAGQFAGCP